MALMMVSDLKLAYVRDVHDFFLWSLIWFGSIGKISQTFDSLRFVERFYKHRRRSSKILRCAHNFFLI